MPPATQKQINKENILTQGVALLTRQGYHGTGLKEILDAVQIPKGSFYNYFGSKENFAAEATRHYLAPFIVQLQGHLQQANGDALAAIKRYFAELIAELERTGLQGGCLLGNLMGEVGDTSEVVRIALQEAITQYRDLLQAGLAQAQLEGTVRTDISAEIMADLLVNAWQGVLLRMKVDKSSQPLKQFSAHLLDDYLRR